MFLQVCMKVARVISRAPSYRTHSCNISTTTAPVVHATCGSIGASYAVQHAGLPKLSFDAGDNGRYSGRVSLRSWQGETFTGLAARRVRPIREHAKRQVLEAAAISTSEALFGSAMRRVATRSRSQASPHRARPRL